MRINVRLVVGPEVVRGQGVPFAPRTMYSITELTDIDGWPSFPLTTGRLYWSRRVAERVASEMLRDRREMMDRWLDKNDPNYILTGC